MENIRRGEKKQGRKKRRKEKGKRSEQFRPPKQGPKKGPKSHQRRKNAGKQKRDTKRKRLPDKELLKVSKVGVGTTRPEPGKRETWCPRGAAVEKVAKNRKRRQRRQRKDETKGPKDTASRASFPVKCIVHDAAKHTGNKGTIFNQTPPHCCSYDFRSIITRLFLRLHSTCAFKPNANVPSSYVSLADFLCAPTTVHNWEWKKPPKSVVDYGAFLLLFGFFYASFLPSIVFRRCSRNLRAYFCFLLARICLIFLPRRTRQTHRHNRDGTLQSS